MNKWILGSGICVFLVITILSLLPPANGIEIPTNDKVGHFLAYATLTLNFSLLFNEFSKKHLILLVGIIIYGTAIEFLQGFIPGRQPSFLDILANTGGAFIGLTLYIIFGRGIKRVLSKN